MTYLTLHILREVQFVNMCVRARHMHTRVNDLRQAQNKIQI